MKSWKTPTPEQVDRAIASLAHPEQRRYFFDRLENPRWLDPLEKKGFFRKPPGIVKEEAERTVRFPPWPESRYLARMAPHEPAKVIGIVQNIETENPAIQEDLLEAILAAPPEMGVELISKVLTWIENNYGMLRPEKFGDLISHLAQDDKVESAISIAHSLLKVFPDPGKIRLVRARFNAWFYERILHKNIPDIVVSENLQALTMLCDLLQNAVELSTQRTGDDFEDYSYIWRPAIEGDRRRGAHEVRDLLVSAVRNTATQIMRTDSTLIAPVIAEVERWQLSIFRRIALHVLRLVETEEFELDRERLTNRSLFENRSVQREYALLLRDRFDLLRAEDRGEILRWIEQGPDLSKLVEGRKAWGDQLPTESECDEYVERWRLKRLRWIRDSLSGEWKKQYETLVRKFGEPSDPEVVRSNEAVWVGPQTPKSEEELRVMPISELIGYLKSWVPSDEPLGPTPEGLGRQLKKVVATEPSNYAQSAPHFQELDPTYVRSLLEGIHEGISRTSNLWEPVIDLCLWIIGQPREIEGRKVNKWDSDPDWGATRTTVGRLLSAGFREGQNELPIALREKVWRILLELTKDPEPTPDYEREFGGSNMEPVTMSINTVRGEAMHSVARYALWVRRHYDKEQEVPQGFEIMPEVREVLETHLDPIQDSALAIRAVYGEWLPWLILLDPEWTTAHLSRIFPDAEQMSHLREAAWEAYIVFCRPYDDVLTVLEQEYYKAVERVGKIEVGKQSLSDPDEHLAEHLMAYYWRGKLDIDQTGGLLEKFYTNASDSLRASAMEFVGRSLRNTEGAVEHTILDRLSFLWQRRLHAARQASQPQDHIKELSAFGWWFVSGKFENGWALRQLLEVLSFSKKVDPDWIVLEMLADMAHYKPHDVIRCVSLIIEGEHLHGWEITGWRGELRSILSTVISQSDMSASQKAAQVIQRLGAKGFLEYRDLLSYSREM